MLYVFISNKQLGLIVDPGEGILVRTPLDPYIVWNGPGEDLLVRIPYLLVRTPVQGYRNRYYIIDCGCGI